MTKSRCITVDSKLRHFATFCRKDVCSILEDYSKECSIHGVRYLSVSKRHWSIKIFWIIALILSFTCCCYLIVKTFDKWQSNPVIVTFDEKSTPIWKIPFPAITICPETKYKKHLFDVEDLLDNESFGKNESLGQNESLSIDHFDKLNALYQVCSHYPYPSNSLKKEVFTNCSKMFNDIAIDFDDSFQMCVWSGSNKDCKNLFDKILTDEGVCWTFNMLNNSELFNEQINESLKYPIHNRTSEHWTLQGGYTSYDAEIYPRRVLGSGITAGLNLELRVKSSDIDYACKGPVQGFKIALHTSGEMPQINHIFYQVPLKQQVLISVKPEVITTSPGLNTYSPKKRQCYFNGEKILKFFKVYTQSNCELECLTEYTLKQCGCVKFSQPHNSSTKVCNFHYAECYRKAKQNFIRDKLEQKLNEAANIIEKDIKMINDTNSSSIKSTLPRTIKKTNNNRTDRKKRQLEAIFWNRKTFKDAMAPKVTMAPKATMYDKATMDAKAARNAKIAWKIKTDKNAKAISDDKAARESKAFMEFKAAMEASAARFLKEASDAKAARDALFEKKLTISFREVYDGFEDECKCLPACTSIEYNAEISQSQYEYPEFYKIMKRTNYNSEYILSTVNIYFKESNVISSKRSELYGITEFLANCGGLLGLFMGFSLISLVEVFYFFFLKLSKKKEAIVINEADKSKLNVIQIATD